jgi:hypothetical protein
LCSETRPNAKPETVGSKLMQTVTVLTFIALVMSVFCLWKKPKAKILTVILVYIHFLSLLLTITAFILLINNYRFIGRYTNSIIPLLLIISGILIFGITKTKLLKFYSGIIFSGNLVFQISLLFSPNAILLPYIMIMYFFQPPYLEEKIDKTTRIEFYEPFLGPPPIFLTEEKYGILKIYNKLKIKNEFIYPVSEIKLIKYKNKL